MSDDTTTPPSSHDSTGDGEPQHEVAALVVVACPALPDRVGESALFRDLHLEHTMGRGPGDGRELRAEYAPRRPSEIVTATPLDIATLSRRHAVITARPFGVDVRLLRQGTLRIAGKVVVEGAATFGDLIRFDDQLLLRVTRRPLVMAPGHLAPGIRGRFGKADRFGIAGETPAVWRMLSALAFAARSAAHVLLWGETGTGKESAARMVHALSDRAAQAFHALNAAGLPEALAEALLFGNIKDYPNPGMADNVGLVGEAAHGTLFLDEIGHLPSGIQAKLLRLLDVDGQYRRIGETRARRADVRAVAAMNSALERLEHDLLARLKVRVDLPNLDDRRDDIPLLVTHLAAKLLAESPALVQRFVEERPDGSRVLRLHMDLVEALLTCEHPENVRGLEKILFKSAEVSSGSRLRPYPELLEAARPRPPTQRPVLRSPGGYVRELTLGEQAVIRKHLASGYGAVTRAARELGLTRYQVHRLARRYGISTASDTEGDDDGGGKGGKGNGGKGDAEK